MFSFNGDANNDPGAGRIGLAYRSKLKYHVVGSVNFTNPTPPTLTGALAPLQPASWPSSAARVNQTRLYNGGVIARHHAAGLGVAVVLSDSSTTSGTSWPTSRGPDGAASRNSRIAAHDRQPCFKCCPRISRTRGAIPSGVNYHYDDKTVLRAGVAYDQSPVNNVDRGAASARQRPHVASGRRPIQVLVRAQLRCRRARTSSSRIRRSTASGQSGPPSIAATGSSTASTSSHVVMVSGQMNYRWR